jgi:hypothetical protein
LQKLEIRFTNIRASHSEYAQHVFDDVEHGRLAPGSVGEKYTGGWYPSCCALSGFLAWGKKIEYIGQIQELCKQAIASDERVLEPLVGIRGVPWSGVVVKGRVTDDWKEYLQMAMESENGTEVGDFDHDVYRVGDRFRDY